MTNDLNITVPTAAYRAGDFSSALTGRNLGTDPLGRTILEGQIFDPATMQIVNGQLVRDPFPGNIIPPERLDKVALAIQKLIPDPTSPNLVALNYRPSFPNDRVTTNWSVKLDHQISAKAKISGLYLTNWSNSQYSQSLNGSEGLPATDHIDERHLQQITKRASEFRLYAVAHKASPPWRGTPSIPAQ